MGKFSVFPGTMASASNSCIIDTGGAWHYQYLVVPTMASGSAIDVYASVDGDEVTQVTYYQMRQTYFASNSAPSYIIAATCAAGGAIVPLNSGFRYWKFIAADSAPTAATTFRVICAHGY